MRVENEHYSEDQLDELARQLGSGPEDSHIQQCKVCRERLAFLRGFHRELKGELTKPSDPKVEALAKHLTRTHVLELKPFHVHHDADTLGLGENAFLLAAQSKEPAHATDVHVAIYASEAKKTLVRIVQKKNEPIYSMHVLSDQREVKGHVIIAMVDESGTMISTPSNEYGVAELKAPQPINWQNMSLLIFTPIASFAFGSGLKPNLESADAGLHIRTAEAGDNVRIEIHARVERGIRQALLVHSDASLSLLPISSGHMAISMDAARRVQKLLFYH